MRNVDLNRLQTDRLATLRLGRVELGAYTLWRDGAARAQLGPRTTFYRHRRAILDALGVDIALRPQEQGL